MLAQANQSNQGRLLPVRNVVRFRKNPSDWFQTVDKVQEMLIFSY